MNPGFISHHDRKKGIILDSNLGRIVNMSPNTEKEIIKVEIHQLRNEFIFLTNRLQQIDERLLELEVKLSTH